MSFQFMTDPIMDPYTLYMVILYCIEENRYFIPLLPARELESKMVTGKKLAYWKQGPWEE